MLTMENAPFRSSPQRWIPPKGQCEPGDDVSDRHRSWLVPMTQRLVLSELSGRATNLCLLGAGCQGQFQPLKQVSGADTLHLKVRSGFSVREVVEWLLAEPRRTPVSSVPCPSL